MTAMVICFDAAERVVAVDDMIDGMFSGLLDEGDSAAAATAAGEEAHKSGAEMDMKGAAAAETAPLEAAATAATVHVPPESIDGAALSFKAEEAPEAAPRSPRSPRSSPLTRRLFFRKSDKSKSETAAAAPSTGGEAQAPHAATTEAARLPAAAIAATTPPASPPIGLSTLSPIERALQADLDRQPSRLGEEHQDPVDALDKLLADLGQNEGSATASTSSLSRGSAGRQGAEAEQQEVRAEEQRRLSELLSEAEAGFAAEKDGGTEAGSAQEEDPSDGSSERAQQPAAQDGWLPGHAADTTPALNQSASSADGKAAIGLVTVVDSASGADEPAEEDPEADEKEMARLAKLTMGRSGKKGKRSRPKMAEVFQLQGGGENEGDTEA